MDEVNLEFTKSLVEKLKRDINAEFLDTNFYSAREKKRFYQKVEKLMNEYGESIKNEVLDKMSKEWNTEVKQALFKIKDAPSSFLISPNKDVVQTLITLQSMQDEIAGAIDGLFGSARITLRQGLNLLESTVRREVMAEIAAGSITGEPIDIIADRVKQQFVKGGIPGFSIVNKNGVDVNYSLESRATQLVRSSIIQSRANAVIDMAVRSGYDLVKTSKHTNESPMCQPHSGKIFSITGATKGYPLLSTALWNGTYKKGAGLFHRYCRHSLTIHIPTSIEFKTLDKS